jgi:glyoxylase-like metal-dependent hydrolase (beta-lactamase superfamily II)
MKSSYLIEVISYEDIKDNPKIHQFSVRSKYFVNSVIIETSKNLIIFDAQQDEGSAKELINYANKLNKPIERLIISHAHIDHYAGMPAFKNIPTYSSKEVIADFKSKSIESKYIPEFELKKSFKIDDINFEMANIKNAHCPNHIVLWIKELEVVLAGDLAQYKGHLLAYNYDSFIAGLQLIAEKSVNYNTLITGHGAITNTLTLIENINYLIECKQIYLDSLSEEEFDRVVREKFVNRSKIRANMGLLLNNPHWDRLNRHIKISKG